MLLDNCFLCDGLSKDNNCITINLDNGDDSFVVNVCGSCVKSLVGKELVCRIKNMDIGDSGRE